MVRLFVSSTRRAHTPGAPGSALDAAAVRLIDSPRRLPETLIEQRVSSRLTRSRRVAFSALVNEIAAELYTDELRNGAGVLDLGLFGSRLFSGDVMRELKAGDGILWEIEQVPVADE